jgi:hypothetical protein
MCSFFWLQSSKGASCGLFEVSNQGTAIMRDTVKDAAFVTIATVFMMPPLAVQALPDRLGLAELAI